MNAKQASIALVAVVLLVGAWLLLRKDDSRGSDAPPDAGAVDEPAAPTQPVASSPPPRELAPNNGPSIDTAKRDAMRALIYKAFGQAAPPAARPSKATYVLPEHGPMWTGTESPDASGDSNVGIEPEYIRDSVRGQFFPIAQKCYVDALAGNPKLGGQIDLWFVIVGDKGVGGIVESVDVLDKSTLRDPDVIECLRESFLGVTFPPPKGGGAVTVEYPIIFSNDDDGGGD